MTARAAAGGASRAPAASMGKEEQRRGKVGKEEVRRELGRRDGSSLVAAGTVGLLEIRFRGRCSYTREPRLLPWAGNCHSSADRAAGSIRPRLKFQATHQVISRVAYVVDDMRNACIPGVPSVPGCAAASGAIQH
ncbi:hypothetical protein MRX96_011254 [Rhipicephalus microplus]